jgi:cytochrome c553
MQMCIRKTKEQKMLNRLWILPLGLSLFLLSGCGDEKQNEPSNKPEAAAKIVVTEGVVKEKKESGKSKENSGQFYYSYNKEKKGEGSEDYNSEASKTRTELDAYRDIRSPYERVQITLMVQQLSPDYRLLCSACHDDYANGVIGPALLDKNSTYIFKQIMAFKTGEKKNALMKELVGRIGDERLKGISKEIERFNRQVQEMRSKK